ncbi:MAG: hypothetical protein IAF02_06415 [Anaerolineae bacterium]|nr:hypothetical protein [Anaerolineae bacterium]
MSKAKFQEKDKSAKKDHGNKKNYGQVHEKTFHKHRKWYLTVAILLVLLSGLFFTLWVFNEKRLLDLSFAQMPWWAWGILVTNIADIVAAVALWRWKKWGLWLYMASVVSRSVLMVVGDSMLVGFAGFLPFAIVGYIVSLNNKQFE